MGNINVDRERRCRIVATGCTSVVYRAIGLQQCDANVNTISEACTCEYYVLFIGIIRLT